MPPEEQREGSGANSDAESDDSGSSYSVGQPEPPEKRMKPKERRASLAALRSRLAPFLYEPAVEAVGGAASSSFPSC